MFHASKTMSTGNGDTYSMIFRMSDRWKGVIASYVQKHIVIMFLRKYFKFKIVIGLFGSRPRNISI